MGAAELRATLVARRRELMRRVRGHPPEAWLVRRGLTLGKGVYINETASLDPDFLWLISIDDEAVIANAVQILAHDGSTRHFTGYIRIGRVHIGRRVYVGAGSIILPGVTIGDDAVIGAGSVVRRDVDARAIVIGNPATQVGTVDEFADRHRRRQLERPCYPSAGFSGYDYVTPENIERMREELSDGSGYVR
jgi:maltose O-acetyltransferase